VSVPALINGEHLSEDATPYKGGNSTRIFCGHEIDLPVEEAKREYPGIPGKQLRKNCYACLIYEWLRCGYAHEYCPHGNITHMPATREKARVSYIGRSVGEGLRRMVSFHLEYLFRLAEYHVSVLPETPVARPSRWWIDEE
jgi:hypothetical protein